MLFVIHTECAVREDSALNYFHICQNVTNVTNVTHFRVRVLTLQTVSEASVTHFRVRVLTLQTVSEASVTHFRVRVSIFVNIIESI